MTSITAFQSAVAAARQPGTAIEPADYMALASTVPTPIQNPDDQTLFANLDRQFSFIRSSCYQTISTTQADEWAKLIRWLIKTLQSWSRVADPNFVQLQALLVVANYMKAAEAPWSELAQDVSGSVELHCGLAALVALTRQTLASGQDAADWEHEAVDALLTADLNEDWAEVARLAPHVLTYAEPSWVIAEASRALAQLAPARLVHASANCPSVLEATAIVAGLSPDQAFALAAETSNDRIRFAVINNIPRQTILSPRQEDDIRRTFKNISTNPDRWAVWIKMIATSPSNSPCLMAPLGAAMGALPRARAAVFVKTLPIYDHSCNRTLATQAFHAYAASAGPNNRRATWAAAYCRWDSSHVASCDRVEQSTLDYAVIRHWVDTLTPSQRRAIAQTDRVTLRQSLSCWHRSRSELQKIRMRFATRRALQIWGNAVLRKGVFWIDFRPARLPRSFSSAYLNLLHPAR